MDRPDDQIHAIKLERTTENLIEILMCTLKRAIGLIMLILISVMVCITSHTEDACAARMVNVSGDVPHDHWADTIYSEIHDSQIENLTWSAIFNHSQERQERDTCKYVEKSIDSTNAVCKDIYGNRTNDGAEEVNLKHLLEGNIQMSVTDANNNRIEDCLEGSAMRAGIDDGDEVDVIVMYHKKSSEPSYSVSHSTLNTLGARVKYNYQTVDATALKMPAGNLNDLAEVPGVEMIYLDHEVHALLDTSVPVIRGDQARSTFGVSGADVTIAVIDTGIDASHESLDDLDDDPATDDDKVIAFEDFVNSRTDPYDDNGHGTHCAGIAAGTGGDSDYVGVAPMSRLVGVKVLDQDGFGSESDCMAGIEWCVLNKDVYGIDVISISWGADMNGDGTSPMELACDSAVYAGIVVCVAAGNLGPSSSTVGTPASAKEVISVGAIEDSTDIAYFSSRGPTADGRTKPDVCAVGVDVTAPAANSGDGYVAHSGTSMATPHVAGVAALMVEYNPYITPSEVKDILHNTSLDKGDLGPDNTYGWGVVDSVAALDNVSAIRITLGAGGPYDPGDQVTITGSTSNRTIPVSAVVNITATSPDGSIVAFNTTTSDSEGDFSVDFVLPDDSEPGDYKVAVTASYGDETGRRIATFKVGTLIIGMDAPDMVITGEPYLLEGGVRYDDGAPVSGADLNVTIKNLNGIPVYTNHTSSNATGHFSILWTPAEASIYAVRITARDAATLKVGLNTTTFQAPCGIVAVAVLDSWGADYDEYTIWDDLNRNWYKYGDYLIDINYTALNKEDITYDDLDLCGADLLVISDAWDDGTWTGNNWEFSDSEISAIKRYVQEGHGLVGTSGTLSTDVPNNMLLAPMFGLDPGEIGEWAYWFRPIFELLRPDHPLFTRIPDPYQSGIEMTVANLALNPEYPGTVVARSKDRTASIYEYRGDHVAAGASVYFTHIVELSDANQEDRQIVYNSFVWAKTNIERKPHEIAVYNLEAPDWIEPDSSTRINATIKNNGLNDESNIEVNFMVDGAIVESIAIPNLASGASIPVSFEWTAPSTKGMYDIAIYAVPVSGETITINNAKNKSVRVITPAGCLKAVVLDSYGTDEASITGFWDDIGDGWHIYGDYVIDIDYTTLNIEDITHPEISDTGADVLIISCASYREFSDSEIAAISQYVEEGHGIIATAGTFDSWVSNNIKLAPLFGMADITGDAYWTSGNFTLYYPDHPIFLGLDDPYQSESWTTNYPWDATTGSVLAMTDDGYSAIITNDVTGTDQGYANIYLNHFPESGAGPYDTQLFYNTIVWAGIPHPKPDHDLCLSGFEYSDRVCCNMPIRFNVTLKNNGLNDETDLRVNLTVDGVVLNSTDISSIAQGTNIPLHISWTPASPGVHRIDLSVTEVPGEAITFNNYLSVGIDVPVAGFSGEYSDYGSDTDGDGLYDYLTIEVGVNVAAAGNYGIYGELYDEYGSWIDYEGRDYVYLNTGNQTVQLDFSGIAIRQNEVNGTYDLRYLRLYDDDWNQLDYTYNAYTTAHYNYTDFQRPPAEFSDIYSDYGADTDGDGLYDYLIIDVGVNVAMAGKYMIEGSLYDKYGYSIEPDSSYTYLNAGNQTITLAFRGTAIRQHNVDGNFYLRYLNLYDGDWNRLGYIYDAYTTSYYNYTEFGDPIPDAYEPDDNYLVSSYISVDGVKQTHNFHVPYDQDWLKFSAAECGSYTVETSNLGDESDTCLHLYGTDGTTGICHDDSGGTGSASKIVWNCSTSGTYYVMVKHFNPSTFGPETIYDVSVTAKETFLRGDVNHDGVITSADAAIALHLAATGGWDSAADVDGDNHITSLDALMIQQAAAGAITL